MIKLLCPLVYLALAGLCGAKASSAPVDFTKEVYPILQKACFECHGPEKKKGGLRLDEGAAALKGGENGACIVAGKPAESELLRRISLPKNDEDVMPSRGALLSPVEIERVRAWIEAGAIWPEGLKPARHWSYVAPVKAPLPGGETHPVDAFVHARLVQEGVAPSPAADPLVLARRLYLDVIGLPPTPAQADAFAAAAQRDLPKAVAALADELLASPQYGEKWARPWLDLARYADSHGFQRDDLRDLWPYRDWVIRALNADMPYDQFSIEQLAGDLLPHPTEAQRVATGFNRSAACNVEAGTDPEENRVNQVIDRVATVGSIWLGSTIECAQCHDHKFDPITQRDFYGLFSFFNQTDLEADRSKPGVLSSIRFNGPYMSVNDPARAQERSKLQREIKGVENEIEARRGAAVAEAAPVDAGEVLRPIDFDSSSASGHQVLEDGSILLVGDAPEGDTYTVTVKTEKTAITGFKLEALTDPSLPGQGPGRGDPERSNFVLNEFSVTAAPAAHPEAARPVKLVSAEADYSQSRFEVENAIHPRPKLGWAIGKQFHLPHWAIFHPAAPVGDAGGTIFTFKLVQEYGGGRTIGRLRLTAMTGPAAGKSAAPKGDPEVKRLTRTLNELKDALRTTEPVQTLVMHEIEKPRASNIFLRGDFRSLGAAVTPSTPAALHPFREEGPPNRLALAKWLVSRENPLAARAYVNRLWSELFGEGLVSTPEDFGIKGEPPSHPELLDWLAVSFMEEGWSPKKLLRLIVTSETYRQDSRCAPELRERDPLNRLLARGPRFRMPAESVRDNALAVTGTLNLEQFGPPIYPPQPSGLWEKVGGQKYDYQVSPGAEQNRRGLYVVLKRGSPYPSFTTFDATARLACRVKRVRSNTPLQALTLLNDPVYVEAAKALAGRVKSELPNAGLDERLTRAFRLVLVRPPSLHELEVLRDLFQSEASAPEGGEEPAWFAVSSTLLNLDEAITKT